MQKEIGDEVIQKYDERKKIEKKGRRKDNIQIRRTKIKKYIRNSIEK